MQNRYKILVFMVLAMLLSAEGFLFAQTPLTFDLRMDKNEAFQMPDSDEFSLSLDSQLFIGSLLVGNLEEESAKTVSVTEVADNTGARGLSAEPVLIAGIENSSAVEYPAFSLRGTDSRTGMQRRSYVPTLTLTTGYDELSLTEDSAEALEVEKKMGKFKIFGKYEQKVITRIPLPKADSNELELRGSSFAGNAYSGSITEQDKLSALASRYYLEATYSFKPTITGRIAYRKSMVDTIDSEEKLEFEGVVEANRNVLIKAGYNNETRPEVNEPKATKDSKVWTEFILKF